MKYPSKDISLFLPSLGGGGAERVMINLAASFAERGLNVDLVLAKAEGPYLREVHKEVRVIDLNAKRVLYSLPALVDYLRKWQPTAMLSTLSHSNIVALWARKIAGVPFRLIIREANTVALSSSNASTLRGRFMPIPIRLFYPWADCIIANSNGVAEDLVKIAGIPAKKVKIIYNPVVTPELFSRAEESLNHPWFAPSEPPVILAVGRLTKQKDFATLIQAFALVHREHLARLVILGEGEERKKIELLIRKLGLEDDVDLPGFVENPYNYMKRAGVFVLSSRWEGFGMVLAEAMTLGTPVISTDCPSGPAEILEGGKWGSLVPVGDIQALASAIAIKLNQACRIDLSLRAKKFGLNTISEEYLKVLKNEQMS